METIVIDQNIPVTLTLLSNGSTFVIRSSITSIVLPVFQIGMHAGVRWNLRNLTGTQLSLSTNNATFPSCIILRASTSTIGWDGFAYSIVDTVNASNWSEFTSTSSVTISGNVVTNGSINISGSIDTIGNITSSSGNLTGSNIIGSASVLGLSYFMGVLQTSNLCLWFDGNDASTMFTDLSGLVPVTTTGDTVRRIHDKSGKGGASPYFASGSGLTYTTNVTNSKSGLAGTGQFLTATTTALPNGSNDLTVFICWKSNGQLWSGCCTSSSNSLVDWSLGYPNGGSGGNYMSVNTNAVFYNGVGGAGYMTPGPPHITTYQVTAAGDSMLWTNSAVAQTTPKTSGRVSTGGRFLLGTSESVPSGGTLSTTAYFCEIVAYNTLIPSRTRWEIEAYLATKWGTATLSSQNPLFSVASTNGLTPSTTTMVSKYGTIAINSNFHIQIQGSSEGSFTRQGERVIITAPTEWHYITSNVTASTLSLATSNYGTLYNITSTPFTGITLPSQANINVDNGSYWTFQNSTSSVLTPTITYTSGSGAGSSFTLIPNSMASILWTGSAYRLLPASHPVGQSVRNISGSAITPSYTFSSDLSSGIYQPTSSQLAFTISGTERLRMNASGWMGLGTTNPAYTLDVSGNTRTTGKFLTASGSATAPSYTFSSDLSSGIHLPTSSAIGFDTSGVLRMLVDNSGINLCNHSLWNVSNINGAAYPPVSGATPDTWASYKAISTVDMSLNSLSNVGMIYNSSGLATAPSYTFSSDLSSGLFQPASSTLAFSVSGNEVARFDPTGPFRNRVALCNWTGLSNTIDFTQSNGNANYNYITDASFNLILLNNPGASYAGCWSLLKNNTTSTLSIDLSYSGGATGPATPLVLYSSNGTTLVWSGTSYVQI